MANTGSDRRVRATVAGAALVALVGTAAASHVVQPGENLTGIARQYGTTVSAIADANGITDPDRIVAGQRLTIPGTSTSASADASTSTTHHVQHGETLSYLARHYGVAQSALVTANSLADPHFIRTGQTLRIPDASATAPFSSDSRAEVGAIIEEVARQHGWSPAFVKGLAWQESGWDNRVVSPVGAVGIMQVLPETNRLVSSPLAGRTLDLEDPRDNVIAGVLFLDHVYQLADKDPELTLAGYYQGLRSVRQNGMYESTERYIANVLALRERFR